MYELDKLSLYNSHKEWCKHTYERKPENIYDMNILNDMNCIHDNKVHNIDEWNLLPDILNSYKYTKYIDIHCSLLYMDV